MDAIERYEHCDCFEFLNSVPDASVDLVLTDPPYAISRQTGFASVVGGVRRLGVSMEFGRWDHDFDGLCGIVDEAFRILREGGTCIMFYDLWKLSHLAETFRRSGFAQLRLIEWLKSNPVPLNSGLNYLTNAREIAVCGVKGRRPTFNSSYDNGLYRFPIYQGKDRIHPTQKPVALFENLVRKHSRPGERVLDCFVGSGTTAIACARSGRRFIGCEADREYYLSSRHRIRRSLKRTS